MDTSQTINCVEWCFGYGGNHLGLKRVLPSLRCIAASEIEAYAVANVVAKIEAGLLDLFPIWSDVKTFPCELFRELVDIFIASYPCQPFSSSGKRKGADDPRHLWPFVRRAVEIIRPRFCFFENVEGHVSLGLREVLTELALLGYRVENSRGEPTWGIFSAAEAGAPQGRKRVFILASREGVVLDDALREQVERFNAGRFSPGTLRTGELADDESRTNGAADEQQHKKRPEELSGGVELENSEGGRDGAVSTRPGNEGAGATELDRAGEGIGLANSSGERQRQGRAKLKGRNGKPALGQSGAPMGDTADNERKRSAGNGGDRPGRSPERSGEGCIGVGLADANGTGPQGRDSEELRECSGQRVAGSGCPLHWPGFVARPGQEQHGWEPPRTIETKRGLGGGINGRASNVDRLRLLGNGVYPATATNAFVTLMMRFIQ